MGVVRGRKAHRLLGPRWALGHERCSVVLAPTLAAGSTLEAPTRSAMWGRDLHTRPHRQSRCRKDGTSSKPRPWSPMVRASTRLVNPPRTTTEDAQYRRPSESYPPRRTHARSPSPDRGHAAQPTMTRRPPSLRASRARARQRRGPRWRRPTPRRPREHRGPAPNAPSTPRRRGPRGRGSAPRCSGMAPRPGRAHGRGGFRAGVTRWPRRDDLHAFPRVASSSDAARIGE